MSKSQDKRWIKNAARMAHEVCRAYDLAQGVDVLPPWKDLSKETKRTCRQEAHRIMLSGCATPMEWFGTHCASTEELTLMKEAAVAEIRIKEYLTFTSVMQTLRLLG